MRKTVLLCLLLIGILETTSAANENTDEDGKIHALIIGDTNDSDIGESVEVDVECVKRSLENIARGINFKLHTVVLTGEKCSFYDITSALRKLNTSSKDIIVFYYSGHGYNDPVLRTCWPVLNTGSTEVLGKRVLGHLKSQQKKFALIIFDCCNICQDGSRHAFGEKFSVKPFVLKRIAHLKGLFKLFRSSSGTIVAAGSEVGSPSSCHRHFGGCFTREFLTSLYDLGMDMNLSWDKVFKLARKKTNKLCLDQFNKEQHPIYRVESR